MRAAIAASFSLYPAKTSQTLPFDFSGFLLMRKASCCCLLGKILKIASNLAKNGGKKNEILLSSVFICISLMQRPQEKIKFL